MFSTFVPGYDSGIFQTVTAQPETTYKLEVYTLNTCWESPLGPDNDNSVLAQMIFRGSSGTLDMVDAVIADATSPLGTWTKHSLIGTAPEGTESLDVYMLFISPSQLGGAIWIDDVLLRTTPKAGIDDKASQPVVCLHQNSPNPFSVSTKIAFDAPEVNKVRLSIFDVKGELVKTIIDGFVPEGHKEVIWDGKDESGKAVSNGIYFYRLSTENSVVTRKMVLVR
ncbi:MAG: FlgD immunoglobulin-like domain containing protein [bacterium]